MKPLFSILLFTAFAALLWAQTPDIPVAAEGKASAHTPAPNEYDAILKGAIFGRPPEAPKIETPVTPIQTGPSPEEVLLQRTIHMNALIQTPDGRTAVGLSDKSANPEKSFLIHLGETKEKILLVSANFRENTATIKKDETEITLKLGAGAVDAPMLASANLSRAGGGPGGMPRRHVTPTAGADTPPAPIALPPPEKTGFNSENPDDWPMPANNLAAIDKILGEGLTNPSYRERLEQRRKALVEERAAKEAANDEAINFEAEERAADMFVRMMRRRNLDMIRAGEGGLGITLTPEEEEMLVKEGVLPPAH